MSSDDESLGEIDNEELLRQYAEEDSGSDDSSDMEPDDPSVTAFRASIAQFNPIITHAVEDDAAAVEAHLRRSTCWTECLETIECHGMPPLHFAALCGSVNSGRALLEAGARADALDNNGQTPLVLAVRAASMRCSDLASEGLAADATELEGFLSLSADLLACGAACSELLKAEGAEALLGWVRREAPAEWRALLRDALGEAAAPAPSAAAPEGAAAASAAAAAPEGAEPLAEARVRPSAAGARAEAAEVLAEDSPRAAAALCAQLLVAPLPQHGARPRRRLVGPHGRSLLATTPPHTVPRTVVHTAPHTR